MCKLSWAILIVLTAGVMAAAVAGDPDMVGDLGFERTAMPDTVSDWDSFQSQIHREGRVFIGGQPNEEAVRSLPEHGVTAVVNLRTPGEMENRERVPFDEAALVGELDIEYVWIPLGGDDHPYTPAAVDTFAAVLERHAGPVLLHCTAAWRASHLWAAYLVLYQGFSVPDAYARGEAMGIGVVPFAKFLDEDLTMVPVE